MQTEDKAASHYYVYIYMQFIYIRIYIKYKHKTHHQCFSYKNKMKNINKMMNGNVPN